jgi:anti-sigma regulatory factor (Ser/Thr protein kinase)
MQRLQPDDADARFDIALPNSAAAAVLARRQLIAFIKDLQLAAVLVADIESAVGEALANAVEHGRRPHGTLHVQASLNGADLEVSVTDDGPGFAPGPIRPKHPVTLAPRGYGLFIIQSVMDDVEFRDGGRTVWFRKRILDAPAERSA